VGHSEISSDSQTEPGSALKSIRLTADHFPMETTLQVLAWAGAVAFAAVVAALLVALL
jgi:hypothetical protein